MLTNKLRALARSVALVLALGGCTGVGPFAHVETTPPPTMDPILEVAEVRRALGLATDPGLLRALSTDAAAIQRGRDAGYDFPLTEAEVALLNARALQTGEVSIAVKLYGDKHPESWAGSYIDSSQGVVVARFVGDLTAHEEALARIVHRDARLRIERAHWTLAELQVIADRAYADKAWFESVDAHLGGVGVDIVGNQVLLDVESDRAEIVEIVQARSGGASKVAIRLSAGPWVGERGTLVVRARDGLGVPATGLDCELIADDPRAAVDVLLITDEGGACTFGQAPAMGVTVVLTSTESDPPAEVARVRTAVRANTVTEVVVEVER